MLFDFVYKMLAIIKWRNQINPVQRFVENHLKVA